MNISVIGCGYVGLVTGACFAETGINVCCIDIDKEKINKLKNGIIPIYEPGLEDLVQKNAKKGRLNFTTVLSEGIKDSDVIFIAVGTPSAEDGSANLENVYKTAEDIGRNINKYVVIVTKSTVPVGTTYKIKEIINKVLKERNLNIEFDIASNPEFLKEGTAIEDFMKPDRIIIGIENERTQKIMEKIYHPFILNNHPIIFMDILSSELTKYACNAMLATRISFMNLLAQLCDKIGADINLVRKGMGTDVRIGNKFLYAGVGFGGSCFPKDVSALVKTLKDFNCNNDLLTAVLNINNFQREYFFKKVYNYYNGEIANKTFTIWGLSFKPNTDDIREAPSLSIIKFLLDNSAKVNVYDPVANEKVKEIFHDSINYFKDKYEALEGSYGLLLITEWNEFRILDYEIMKQKMKEYVIFDGRNIYNPMETLKNGFKYFGIGRRIE